MAFFGSQFLINAFTDRDQDNVSLAGLTNGLFVAVFETKQLIPNPALGTPADDIGLQIFNADRTKRGDEINLTFGSVFGSFDPVVAAAPDATFYVGYETLVPSGATSLGSAHRDIDMTGLANGDLGFPGVGTADTDVAIAVRADGGRFAVFQSSSVPSPGPDDPQIRRSFFNEAVDNGVQGDEVNVNAVWPGADTRPDVAALESGRFVTVWEDGATIAFRFSDVTYGPDPNFPAQLPFVATTTHFGGDTGVAPGSRSAVAALPGNRFVVLWYNDGGGNPQQILGRVYDGNGNAAGGGLGDFVAATNVDRNAGADRDIAVTVLQDGTFVVAWTGLAGTVGAAVDNSGTHIEAAVFNSAATPGTNPFTVIASLTSGQSSLTTITNGDQFDPSLAALADGRFVLGWTDASASGDDASGLAVRGQVFDTRTAAVALDGTAGHDDYIGSDFADTLNGLGADDRLAGGKGNDTLDGGADNDTAVYSGARAQYRVDQLANGDLEVVDLRVGAPDGADTVRSIESFLFSDGTFAAGAVINQAPQIDSNGGGATATVSMAENTVSVTTVTAADPNSGTSLAYSIVGGADQARFQIDASSGALSFATAPDFETPTDSDANNSYIVEVSVTDGSLADTQALIVNVTDVNESAPAPPAPPPAPPQPGPGDNDGNALFDTPFYLGRNPDVFQAGVDALEHFNTFGFREGRDPNAFFDTSGYLAVNKDVAATGINPLDHFHQSGWKEGRDPSADFDSTLYLIHNPDVAAAGVDPLEHFLQFGLAEGRSAHAAVGGIFEGFDAQFYLFHNPDVAAAGVDPLAHFNSFGWQEGRDPNSHFDTSGYLSAYADVVEAGVNPLQHYELFGFHEGRDPSASFDTLGYLAANPDVAAANVNPLSHYLQFGIYEGRAIVNDGLFH